MHLGVGWADCAQSDPIYGRRFLRRPSKELADDQGRTDHGTYLGDRLLHRVIVPMGFGIQTP